MHVLNSILPVFLLIATGVILNKTHFVQKELIAGTNKLVYFIGLPSLLFRKMAISNVDLAGNGDLFLAVALTMSVLTILAWLFAASTRLAPSDRGTFAQAAMRCNAAFVGLPVIAFVTNSSIEAISPTVILLLSIIVILNNIFSVVMLMTSTASGSGKGMISRVLAKTALNPLILASVAGLLYSLLIPTLPIAIDRSLAALGSMSLPLALIGIGATIDLGPMRHHARTLWAAAAFKTAIAPLLAVLFAIVFRLPSEQTLPFVIFMAGPTAAASYVLVDQIGGDRELAAGAVALSTLTSFISFTVVIALL
jgi:malate permease and related proteins